MSKPKKTKEPLCSICRKPIDVQLNGWAEGHNAEPVKRGRCCSDCNTGVVIPIRLAALVRRDASAKNPKRRTKLEALVIRLLVQGRDDAARAIHKQGLK